MTVSLSFHASVKPPIRRFLRRMRGALERAAPRYLKKLPQEIMVIVERPSRSRFLNRRYRGKDAPANVLSFIYDASYAEVFITPSVINTQARAQGDTFEYALAKMLVHGMIHCSGLDHERSAKREREFEKTEQRLLGRVLKEAGMTSVNEGMLDS